jgi:RNA polymerase sigma-70 factor (ECF subfamily)
MIDLDVYATSIARGDANAFAAWLATAEAPLRASLTSFAAKVDVEAIVQEALIRTWRVAPRFESDGSPNGLFRLTVRIARNLAVSELRRRRHEVVAQDTGEDELAAPAVTAPDPLLRALIQRCLSALQAAPRKVWALRMESAGALPDEVLAERASMRLNTFLQNITRARRQLATCLERGGVTFEGLGT